MGQYGQRDSSAHVQLINNAKLAVLFTETLQKKFHQSPLPYVEGTNPPEVKVSYERAGRARKADPSHGESLFRTSTARYDVRWREKRADGNRAEGRGAWQREDDTLYPILDSCTPFQQ